MAYRPQNYFCKKKYLKVDYLHILKLIWYRFYRGGGGGMASALHALCHQLGTTSQYQILKWSKRMLGLFDCLTPTRIYTEQGISILGSRMTVFTYKISLNRISLIWLRRLATLAITKVAYVTRFLRNTVNYQLLPNCITSLLSSPRTRRSGKGLTRSD